MDDNRSTLSSIYWDAGSMMSDSTMPFEDFYTPMGSLMNLSLCETPKGESGSESGSCTPRLSDIKILQDNSFDHLQKLPSDDDDIVSECVVPQRASPCPECPPPITLQKCISAQLETLPMSSEKKSWRRSFAKRVSFTKTRIMKSLSLSKHDNKSQGPPGFLMRVRNSMRIRRLSEKQKQHSEEENRKPKSVKDTLGSDCEYFNFDKCSIQRTSEAANEVFQEDSDSVPIKPRRQFPQDKYLTGSEAMLQNAYNSLNRKSQTQEDKSLFDLCSTLIYLFESMPEDSQEAKGTPVFISDCVDAFLEMNSKQIESGLQTVNRDLGFHFDLQSENLDQLEKSKKYKVEELLGSDGVCVITDTEASQRYIALKKTTPRNWVSFTGFLQHIDKEVEQFASQTWVCYPADSITNMYLERDYFETRLEHSKWILDSLLQLMVLLHGQVADDPCKGLRPSNVLLISSNLSLVCVFDKGDLSPEQDETPLSAVNTNGDESMRLHYQKSLMRFNDIVANFLSYPDHSFHLISASYPLDYLFFIFLKLHKDIKVLLDSL